MKITAYTIRTQRILKQCLALCSVCIAMFGPSKVYADALLDIDGSKEKYIVPRIEQQEIDTARIDREKFEALAYLGTYSVENFDTRLLIGVTGSFFFTPKFFLNLDYGSTEIKGETEAGNAATLIEESLTRYDAALGYNLFEGKVFWKDGQAFNNQFYLKYGRGRVDIKGNTNNYATLGFGLRVLHPNDKLTMHIGTNLDSVDASSGGSSSSNIKFFGGLGIYF